MQHSGLSAWFWALVCASFVATALVHAFEVFAPGSAAMGRHALFVAINLGVAWGCWRRPRWFIGPFALLLVQQLFSHGRDFAQAWPERVDWRSLFVLIGMPIVGIALWRRPR